MSEHPTPESTSAHTPLPAPSVVALDDQLVLRIAGPAADQFLHGQFSQSLEDVTATQSPRAAACTPKGRAYCLTRFVRDGDDVLLNLPRTLAEDVQGRLGKYLMLFRGTTMAEAPEVRILGLLGEELARQLSPGTLPEKPGDTMAVDGHRLVRTDPCADGLARYEFWQLGPLSTELAQTLGEAQQSQLADWQASEIAAGIAMLSVGSQEAYVPQMLNWQHVGGVHFRKGCYTGQEVVARMHFLGQLKKSLYRLGIDSAGKTPSPGAKIADDSRDVGEVVNAVAKTDGSVELLAVIRHDAATDSLHLVDGDQRLSILPLPYPVPEREANSSDT